MHSILSAMTDETPLPAPHTNIRLSRQGPIGWLTFDRPEKRNALTLEMWRALPRAMRALREQEGLRVIVLRGAGGHFSSGADISEFTRHFSGPAVMDYEAANLAAFRAVADAPMPSIAMIEGFCIGGGLALALCCDIRLASSGATFAIPPAKLGLAYPLHGLQRLLQAVSPAFAREMIFSARRVDAEKALRAGLVNDVREKDALHAETLALARGIAANAPLSIAHARAAINAIAEGRLEAERDNLAALARACFTSADYAEGRRAFAEKRKPRFTGD